MSTDWEKHFTEQVINKGSYDLVDSTVLTELFRMLDSYIFETDEDGDLLDDIFMIQSYAAVLRDFLTPEHIIFLNKMLEDMDNERQGKLLQEEPQPQAPEGEGQLQQAEVVGQAD